MSDMVIKVENISKQYQLGKIGYGTLKHDLQSWYANIRGKNDPNALIDLNKKHKDLNEEFWALKDVSFKINSGESIGIIGKNGAGKSTLLKILSRITAPTSGEIKIKGKVTSLLEVGTGFHPELTGRENVFLNGAILGMNKKKINKKFDEIVAFSGIENFIDTPVKRYSSGMYVRLAFAVAANLDSEILVLDEVLAVGDVEFQEKCLKKMDDVSRKDEKTILFVSHNIFAVKNLCQRCILLHNGKIEMDSNTNAVIKKYNEVLRNLKIDENLSIDNPLLRRGGGNVRFTSIELQNVSGMNCFEFKMGETIRFKFSYKVYKKMKGLFINIVLHSSYKIALTSTKHIITENEVEADEEKTIFIEWPTVYIRPGEYPLLFQISDLKNHSNNRDVVDNITHPLIIIEDGDDLYKNFDIKNSIGFFSIPSRLSLKKL